MPSGTLTSTSMNTLATTGASSAAVPIPDPRTNHLAFVIVATSVTTGAKFVVECMRSQSAWIPVGKFPITANGSYAFGIDKDIASSYNSARVTCLSRTDGSYVVTKSVVTRGT